MAEIAELVSSPVAKCGSGNVKKKKNMHCSCSVCDQRKANPKDISNIIVQVTVETPRGTTVETVRS